MKIDSFKLGNNLVKDLTIRKIGFIEFGKLRDYDLKKQNRNRIIASVMIDGNKITSEQVSILPVNVAKKIMSEINSDEYSGKRGEILSGPESDGILSPIVYKLGKPIVFTRNGKEKIEVTELEFSAKTYIDIEDIIAENDIINQTIAMLTKVAKPLGNSEIMVLPSSAINQITIADGMFLALEVLKNFTLEQGIS